MFGRLVLDKVGGSVFSRCCCDSDRVGGRVCDLLGSDYRYGK